MATSGTNKGRPPGIGKGDSPLLKSYEERISTEMRVLLAAKNLSQKEVAFALEKAGIKESAKGLSSKINAGTCSAAYFLAFKDIVDSM
jgi:hypothetical protein